MYWPDLRHIVEMDRALRRHAKLQAATAKANAEEAFRWAEQQRQQAGEADVEDAEWRELPQERLPPPAQS